MSKRLSGESLKVGKSAKSFFPLLLVLVLVVSCASVVFSQPDQKRARETAKVRDKIMKCANKANSFSEIKLRNRTKLLGQVSNPVDSKFTLTEQPSRRVIEIPYEDVSNVWCGDFTARMNRCAFLFALLAGLATAGIAAAAH